MTCDDTYVRAYVHGTHEDNEAPLAPQTSLRNLAPPVVVVLYKFCLYVRSKIVTVTGDTHLFVTRTLHCFKLFKGH